MAPEIRIKISHDIHEENHATDILKDLRKRVFSIL